MSHLAELVAGLRRDFQNDNHRLIIADWYEENHQPERAVFIRQAIIDTARKFKNVTPYRIYQDQTVWYKGFICGIYCAPRNWIPDHKDLLSVEPIVEVTFDRSWQQYYYNKTFWDSLSCELKLIRFVTQMENNEFVYRSIRKNHKKVLKYIANKCPQSDTMIVEYP